MNAIELLEQQHEEVMSLLNELEKSEPGSERKDSFKKMQSSLLAHMVIEEELFYPAVAECQPEGEPVAEGYEEHMTARTALDRCQRALAEDNLFQVRVGVLKELIRHHVQEERSEILPRAKKAMPDEELQGLGAQMEERFQKALKGHPAATLNRMSTTREKSALSASP